MNNQSSMKDQNIMVILGIIIDETPQTTEQLIKIAREKTGLSERETAALILQLEKEDKLHFADKEPVMQVDSVFVVFSKKTAWFWFTVSLAVSTVAVVFMIPGDLYPVVYLRQFLGLVFVLFLPGYAFVRMLFPYSVPFKTSSGNLDNIERVALGTGLSLALAPIVGLILYFTPLGLGLVPITLSLLALTLIFGFAALVREYQAGVRSGVRAPSL